MQYSRRFLNKILTEEDAAVISEGWVYGPQEAVVYGGYTAHQGVGFAVPFGTPMRAAAAGIAMSSFEEVAIRYPGPQQNIWQGEPVYWGLGLFVVIAHRNGWATLYGHLHTISQVMQGAYIHTSIDYQGDIHPHIPPFKNLREARRAGGVSVRAGEIIGTAGITGMGLGEPTYGNWLRQKDYRANDEYHVHFAVSTMPVLDFSTQFLDPFGIYGDADQYRLPPKSWHALNRSPWRKF